MKVLVLTLSFGSGHVSAARAVARELEEQSPDVEVRVVDALTESRKLFRACYVWPYWAMVRYAPSLWDRLFRARVIRKHQHTAPGWTLRWGCSSVFKAIAELKPEVIVATEVAACELATMARREALTDARIVNVITDHEAEPIWVQPEIEIYAVSHERVAAELRSWGAPPEKIVICGIPTTADFGTRRDNTSTRARYRLDERSPVVLLMGGGMGPARMDQVAAGLCNSDQQMQIVAITGHDARMRRKLERLGVAPPSLCILGWIDDVAALMQTASVLVTKPGGLTIAEAALCELPLVMFDAIPGPELRNAEHFAAAGGGVVADGPDEAVAATLSLLRDEHMRKRMSASAKRFSRPHAANEIARLVLQGVVPARTVARRTTA
jgi:processive 1,2-diacylglycerol beta-glucosyltransferase